MLKTYDVNQVSMIFAGVPVSGLADGTVVSIEQNNDSFSLKIGAGGEGCRAKMNDRSAKVTFTLLQSSITNDAFSALHNIDVNSPNGDGIGPLLVKDNNGRSIFTAEKAWIVKPASVEYSQEVSNREWTIETDNLIQNIGGN